MSSPELQVEREMRNYFVTTRLYDEIFSHATDAQFKVRAQSAMGNMVAQLVVQVAGERIDEIRSPSDWWQAVKERFFPAWALKRWPVDYDIWKVDIHFPRLKSETNAAIRVYHNKTSWGYPHSEDARKRKFK